MTPGTPIAVEALFTLLHPAAHPVTRLATTPSQILLDGVEQYHAFKATYGSAVEHTSAVEVLCGLPRYQLLMDIMGNQSVDPPMRVIQALAIPGERCFIPQLLACALRCVTWVNR